MQQFDHSDNAVQHSSQPVVQLKSTHPSQALHSHKSLSAHLGADMKNDDGVSATQTLCPVSRHSFSKSDRMKMQVHLPDI